MVDLAFNLGGIPKELSSFTAGSLDWHPSAAVFSGAGISENGAPFNYRANWESAGRWGVEVLTKEHKLILRPMEKLQIQTCAQLKSKMKLSRFTVKWPITNKKLKCL